MAWDHSFDVALNPRAVAFVGVSRNPPPQLVRWLTVYGFMESFIRVGFKGRIYPVNPDASEVLGHKVYPDLKSIPEPVDLVIIGVPASRTPEVLQQCIETNNKNVHILTAGFDEFHTEAGRRLGQQVRGIIRKGGLRVIGPNAMGISHAPSVPMTVWDGVPMKSGPMAIVSQSGAFSRMFIDACEKMGTGISKAISIGNSFGLCPADFLAYFAHDPETEFVGLYLEQAVDGRQLLEAVKALHWSKPIAIFKGGVTGPGARAASSHTAAMAGESHIWDAFFRQTRAIHCDSIEEMADVLVALMCLPAPKSNRLGLITGGGGNSVVSADLCAQAGLDLPILTDTVQAQLATYITSAGQSIRNPLDLMFDARGPEQMERTAAIVASDPQIDMLLMQGMFLLQQPGDGGVEKAVAQVVRIAREKVQGKPLALLIDTSRGMRMPGLEERLGPLVEAMMREGIPVFPSLPRAAKALARAYRYHRDRQEALGVS